MTLEQAYKMRREENIALLRENERYYSAVSQL